MFNLVSRVWVPAPHTGTGVRFKFLAWNQPKVGCERLNTKFPPETGEDFLFAVHGRETCVGQSPPCFLLKLRFNGFAARTRRVQKVLIRAGYGLPYMTLPIRVPGVLLHHMVNVPIRYGKVIIVYNCRREYFTLQLRQPVRFMLDRLGVERMRNTHIRYSSPHNTVNSGTNVEE